MKSKAISYATLVFILFLLGVFACLVLGLITDGSRSNDPMQVGDTFENALMKNDSMRVKSMVIPEQWALIDEWVAERKSFSCPFHLSLDQDIEGGWSGGGGWSGDGPKIGDTTFYNSSYHCASRDYEFSIIDALLQKRQDRWVILRWVSVCEEYRMDGIYNCISAK